MTFKKKNNRRFPLLFKEGLGVVTFFCIFSFCSAQTATTTSASTRDICNAISSLDIYTPANLKKVQTYIKQKYFAKILITGRNDLQTKYYIKKFQYAYGLEETGLLNEQTIKYLKDRNNCFDLESKIIQLQNSTTTNKKTIQQDLILDLIVNFINSIVTVTSQTH